MDKMKREIDYHDRKAILELAARRLKQMPVGEFITLPWDIKLKWNLVKFWDAIQGARKIVESRTPKWKRIGRRVLKIAEAILFVVAGYYAKKLPL